MLQPGRFPLVVYQGDTASWQFMLWQDAGKSDPVDLTGASVASQVRNRPGGMLIATLDCAVTLPNTVLVTLAAADSAALPTAPAAWDMQVTWPSGDVTTVVAGPVNVTADVTMAGAS